MLKEILSISGKPGLYKMVSQAKNMLIVESLVDGKRMPAYTRDKAVSLGDIAIFTDTGEVTLGEVLEKLKTKENGKEASINPKSDNDTLRNFMEEVLPDFDRDRVYPSDIRKIVQWYNLLIKNDITEFLPDEEDDESEVKEKETKVKAENKPTAKGGKVQAQQAKSTQKTAVNRKMGG